jgi:hypothetical protein
MYITNKMAKLSWKKKVNINRVVAKVVMTVLALWVGGTIMTEVGTVMNGTSSPFYKGLSLIGWTVDDTNTITDTSGAGVLSVIGIIGIASIVLEFVEFSF